MRSYAPRFFLFRHLKNKVFRSRLHTLEQMQNAIVQEINNIGVDALHRVYENLERRVRLCLEDNDHHFQHLL